MGTVMTLDEIRKDGLVTAGKGGEQMVTVRALLDKFRDNGKCYAAGDLLHMEISVAQAALAAGQVELAPKEEKQA